jgi:hypothetical protein
MILPAYSNTIGKDKEIGLTVHGSGYACSVHQAENTIKNGSDLSLFRERLSCVTNDEDGRFGGISERSDDEDQRNDSHVRVFTLYQGEALVCCRFIVPGTGVSPGLFVDQ